MSEEQRWTLTIVATGLALLLTWLAARWVTKRID